MSLHETSSLLAESRKIVEAGNDPQSILNLILKIVTNIDSSMDKLDKKIDKRINDLNDKLLSVITRVSKIEKDTSELHKKFTICEESCQGVSNLFDNLEQQVKINARKITKSEQKLDHIATSEINKMRENMESLVARIRELEAQMKPDRCNTNNTTIRRLQESVEDLQCRSMKNNLIFTNLNEHREEDTERKLRLFLQEQLGIDYHIEFGNVHRFGKHAYGKIRPIVARFLYHKDLQFVLEKATWLKDTKWGIHQQFPKSVEDRRKPLYPVQKEARRQGKRVTLVRDKLFINGKQYVPDMPAARGTPARRELIREEHQTENTGFRDALLTTPKESDRPYKRPRQTDTPPHAENFYG